MKRIWLLLALVLSAQAIAADMAIFERAWQIVNDRYWNPAYLARDWNDVYNEYRPLAEAAESEDALYEVIELMYGEIGDNHSAYLPPSRVEEAKEQFGSLRCITYFGAAASAYEHAGAVRYTTFGPVGYVDVPDFMTDGVTQAIKRAITGVSEAGAESLILDLRGNPGGQLVTMMEVAGLFTGGLLWRIVMRWSLPMPYPALGFGTFTDLPLVILIDEHVHSAAEGLAGALQNSGRATVIGATTAGNVEAVLPFCLRDGSQAWIATGVLAPVIGPTWEGRGVAPDYYAPGPAALSYALGWLRGTDEP